MSDAEDLPVDDEFIVEPHPDDGMVAAWADRIDIVLVRPMHWGNVGAAARAMKNMGLCHLVQVEPRTADDDRVPWMAPGAHDILDSSRIVGSVAEAVEDCHFVVGTTARARRYRWPVLPPAELAATILDHPGRVAILFGPEDKGLDNDALLRCHALTTIPTDRAHSLNLAQAVLLICHHLFEEARRRGYEAPARLHPSRRGRRTHPAEPRNFDTPDVPATVGQMRALVDQAVSLLACTPYLSNHTREQVGLTLCQLLERVHPAKREIEILLGMVGKLRWTLEHPGER